MLLFVAATGKIVAVLGGGFVELKLVGDAIVVGDVEGVSERTGGKVGFSGMIDGVELTLY